MSKITRRDFMNHAGLYTAGGIALSTGASGLMTSSAHAQTTSNWLSLTPRPDWLSLTKEAALEPELPIIDPHHHLWDRPNSRYLIEDVARDTSGHNVRQTVFVECTSMYREDGPEEFRVVGETEFVQGVAAKSASGGYGKTRLAAGIVGAANLRLGDRVAAVLEAQMAASPQRFRGIRHRAAWADPSVASNSVPEHLLLDPDYRKGFAHLRSYGLSFEGWVFHTQIDELTDLAKAFPDTTIIFNHLGGPIGIGIYAGRRAEVFAAWKAAVSRLAQCPNVVAKLGGIQMAVNGNGWHEQDKPPTSDQLLQTNKDWYEHMFEEFGPDRCMFESNFPVDKISCSYTVLWNQFKKLTVGYSADERASMFHDTAQRVYRLPTV